MITPQWLRTKGGPTTTVYNLAQQMRALGHSVEILTSEEGPGALLFRERIVVREFQILRHLRKFHPQVIHIQGRIHYILSAWLYRLLCSSTAKIVFTFHTQPRYQKYLPDAPEVRKPYTGLQATPAKFLLRRCDRITSVSKSLVESLNENSNLGISDYAVIPSGGSAISINPRDVEEFKAQHALESRHPILSTLGVFAYDWKVAGHQIAIEAVKILSGQFPCVRLLVVGDGTYRRYLVEVAKTLGVEENIIFCGSMDKPEIAVGLSDIYLHIGLNEGSPLAVVEAMFARKPIIAANRGGIPEIVTHNETGILVEPNPWALAEAVGYLISKPKERLRIAQNAFSYASKNLDWGLIAERYLVPYSQRNTRSS
jgi:glycosyltransferase involved in cell wall biosynthesis